MCKYYQNLSKISLSKLRFISMKYSWFAYCEGTRILGCSFQPYFFQPELITLGFLGGVTAATARIILHLQRTVFRWSIVLSSSFVSSLLHPLLFLTATRRKGISRDYKYVMEIKNFLVGRGKS